MPPVLIADPASVDFTRVVHDRAAIEARIPQRFEMAFLDRVHVVDEANGICVGSRDIRADEFWVKGHVPGRPLLPGVLAVEALAQTCTFYYALVHPEDQRFMGFGAVDGVKFRGTIVPGDRLVLATKAIEIRSRRCVFDAQAMVGDRLVVEARITGMPV